MTKKTIHRAAAMVAILCAGVSIVLFIGSGTGHIALADEENQFVGSDKCKNCHSGAKKGDQHGSWLKHKHAKAYATLATPEAKKLGETKGVAEPQKDKACLACHVTAFNVPDAQKNKKFDMTQGVQCETCHGPGGKHVKARLAAEEEEDDSKVVTIGKDEIIHVPNEELCLKCHNADSPNYKEFKFAERLKEVAHPDPRRKHPADHLDKLIKEHSKK
jgi:hypothetical protein